MYIPCMYLNEVVGGGTNIFIALEEQRNHSESKYFVNKRYCHI